MFVQLVGALQSGDGSIRDAMVASMATSFGLGPPMSSAEVAAAAAGTASPGAPPRVVGAPGPASGYACPSRCGQRRRPRDGRALSPWQRAGAFGLRCPPHPDGFCTACACFPERGGRAARKVPSATAVLAGCRQRFQKRGWGQSPGGQRHRVFRRAEALGLRCPPHPVVFCTACACLPVRGGCATRKVSSATTILEGCRLRFQNRGWGQSPGGQRRRVFRGPMGLRVSLLSSS